MKKVIENKIIGKTINDSYGREYGNILGFHSNQQDKISLIWIKRSNGDFTNCSISQITFDGESAVFNNSWTEKTYRLNEKLNTILRKISVLNKLHSNRKIAKEVYYKTHMQYEIIIQSLIKYHHTLFNNAKNRLEALNSQIDNIHFFLANLKVDRSLIHVEEAYKGTSASTRVILNRTMKEKRDVETALNKLTGLLQNPDVPYSLNPKLEDALIQPIVFQTKVGL